VSGPFSLLSCGYGRLFGAGQRLRRGLEHGVFLLVFNFALSESDYVKAIAIFFHVDAIKAYRGVQTLLILFTTSVMWVDDQTQASAALFLRIQRRYPLCRRLGE
jgi:hypothetical protein